VPTLEGWFATIKQIDMNIKSIIIVLIISIFVSCSDSNNKEVENNTWKHKVLVEEVIQTGSYTYLLISENGSTEWIAVSSMDAKVNDILYYNSGLEMIDFHSKELQRTFDKLLLVQVISDDESGMKSETRTQYVNNKPTQNTIATIPDNGKNTDTVTLTELFNNTNKYNGKRILVSGNVVKVNPNIMGRNWVHIKDGKSSYDLTITTNDNVKIDDVVTFEGVITLNKDFGAGYKYPIIMEEGILK